LGREKVGRHAVESGPCVDGVAFRVIPPQADVGIWGYLTLLHFLPWEGKRWEGARWYQGVDRPQCGDRRERPNPFSIFPLGRGKVGRHAVEVIAKLAATMVARAACPDVGVSPAGGGTKLSG